MNKNNKIIIAAIAVVALLLVIGALFASGILSGNDDDNDTTYKVSFIDGDDVIKTLNVKENNLVSRISDPEKEGYIFTGWYSDKELTNEFDFENTFITENTNIYAKWVKASEPEPGDITFTVTFNTDGANSIASQTVKEGEKAVKPADPLKSGYKFEGWYSDSSFTTKFDFKTPITFDITLYAKFTVSQGGGGGGGSITPPPVTDKTYTVTFNSNGGSAVNPITADYNAPVTLPTPTREGHTFAGWYSDESLNTQYTSDKMPAENITLFAKWTKNSYTLTINYVYENGSEAHESYVKSVVYGEAYTVTSPSIESFLPDIPTVTGIMPANDLTIVVTYGDYLISIDGNNYRTIEDALASAQEGDRLILLRDYTIQKDLTIPKGILLVLPCSDDDVGYDLTAEYEKEHNPDGTSTNKGDLSVLYRTLTIPSGVTLNIEGQLLVNAVTGRPAAGHYDMDITGGYSQIILDGNITVKNGGLLEVCGYVKGEGLITAESGAELRDLYVVKNWRGGSQAFALFPDVFPFNEYDCHNIQSTIQMESGASLSGNVKMYASGSYHYTRFPQVDNENGLIRLADGAHLIKTYADYKQNGSSDDDIGRTSIVIYGGATFSHSTLPIVGLNLSTKSFIYPVDGDINFGLYDGNYIIENDFKLLTGVHVILGGYDKDTTLTLNKGNTLVLYDEFNDVDNTSTTEYPNRPAAELVLYNNTTFNINGKFAGIISIPDFISSEFSKDAIINAENAEALSVDTIEANGYLVNVPNDYPKFVNLHFETKYQYTLSFETNGGLKVSSIEYFVGEDIEIPTPIKTGYDFKGWYLDSNLTQKYEYEALTGNTTLYAKWEDSKYTVSFETNRGSSVDSQEILFNNTVTKPSDPIRSGYVFEGWYSDAALTSEYNFSTLVTENLTLYAKWTAVEYTISFVTNNGENLDSIKYTADDASLNIQELSKTGYTFEKWCIDEELTTGFEFKQYETSGDLTLYAKWVPVVYTIKYYDGTQLNLGPSSYTIEDSIALPTATKLGYEFAGWHENSDLSGDATFSINKGTTGNKEYYASWNESVYSITYMDGNSRITAESGWPTTYTSENATTLPTSATKTGYTFAGWYDNADLSGNAVTSIPAQSIGDKVLYAKFVANSYLVSFNANSGEGSMEDQSFTYDATQKLTANSFKKKGYTFLGWSLVKDATKADYTDGQEVINLTPENGGLVTLYAVWEITKYKIYYVIASDIDELTFVEDSTFSNTSLNPSSYTINDRRVSIIDGNATYGFVTRDGYTFSKWTVYLYPISGQPTEPDGISRNGSLRVSLNGATGDLIAISHWTINKYTITFDSTGGSEVPSKTIEGDYKSKIVKPIDPTKEGYTFAGWYKDVDCKDVWDFNVDTIPAKNITLYAGWTSGTNTVTLPSGTVNGYEFTSNASTGFDESNVPSGSDFKFNVTFNTDLGNNIPTITWDDNIKSPDSQNGLTYQFTIPDVTNDITISLGIVDTTALKEFVNNAASSNYKLSIDKWILTVEISNPNADASILIDAISAKIGNVEISTNPNSGRTTTNLLAYLPDDNMLWENNLAEYIVEVAGYKIIFKQDEDAVEEAKIRYLTEIAQAVRVFRNNPDYYPLIVDSKSYSEIFSISAGIEDDNYKFIDIGVLQTHSQDNQNSIISLAHALASNYATVTSLVGHEDALWGRYDLNADFSNAILKDPVDLNIDLLDTKDIQVLYRAALVILKDMQIPIDSAFSPVEDCFNNGVGYGGYGKYYCASVESGIRYTDIYHIKFTNYFEESKPASHTISFSDNILDKISLQNFATHNSLADVTFDAHNAENHVISETGLLRVTFNTNANKTDIYKYELSRLVAGELIVVNINQNSKLTMSDIAVTTSSGANVEWYNSNSFIMPDGNVTISLKGEQTETLNIIHSLSLQALVQERSSAVTHLQILS